MTISKEPCKIVVYGKIIVQVMIIRYIGIELSTHGGLYNEVWWHIIKADKTAASLSDILWKNKYTRVVKSQVYIKLLQDQLCCKHQRLDLPR